MYPGNNTFLRDKKRGYFCFINQNLYTSEMFEESYYWIIWYGISILLKQLLLSSQNSSDPNILELCSKYFLVATGNSEIVIKIDTNIIFGGFTKLFSEIWHFHHLLQIFIWHASKSN